jgi:hypothetical protein
LLTSAVEKVPRSTKLQFWKPSRRARIGQESRLGLGSNWALSLSGRGLLVQFQKIWRTGFGGKTDLVDLWQIRRRSSRLRWQDVIARSYVSCIFILWYMHVKSKFNTLRR